MSAGGDTHLRVLVVDDDALDREAVRRALRKLDPPPLIAEASCMADALEQLGRDVFDCVVLDYLLPEGPCLEFLGKLRATAPLVAFVVLTGQGDEDIAVELMKAGAADYLSKDGLDPARLRQALKYAVALRQAERQAAAAEAGRRAHSDQLRIFVERVPALVAARSLAELAEAAAELAVEVLQAREVFVQLRHGGVEYGAQRGVAGPKSQLASWAKTALSQQPAAIASQGDEQLALALRSRDGENRGVIALRCASATGPAREHVFGQLGVMVSVCSDNLVLYDATARAIRARDDVMAVVSHDLRNPLNNIRLGVNLLRDNLPKESQSVIARVERNVTHMGRLVDDLVDMVRLEGGKLELSIRNERASELLESASQLIADEARDHGIALELGATAPLLLVAADRDRVLQVLSNLLGNALKFTPAGGRIALEASDQGDGVCFEVRDSGRGIPAEEGDRVFSRFWRSDPKKRQGLGLGLYIAKGLIQAHGGRLWYQSQEGRGTSFFFSLPKPSDARAVGVLGADEHDGVRRAAVIEDDDDTRMLIANALARAGFQVSDYSDAETFLALRDFSRIAVVVSDIGLPGRDGIAVCEAVRASATGVPVLLITAFRDDGVFHRAQVLGCEILTKPLNMGQLAERATRLAKRT